MKTKYVVFAGLFLATIFLTNQTVYAGITDYLSKKFTNASNYITNSTTYKAASNYVTSSRLYQSAVSAYNGSAVAKRNILSGLGIGPNMTLSPQAVGKNCTSVKLVGFVKGIPITVPVPNTTSICNSSTQIPIGNNTSARPTLIQKEIPISNR